MNGMAVELGPSMNEELERGIATLVSLRHNAHGNVGEAERLKDIMAASLRVCLDAYDKGVRVGTMIETNKTNVDAHDTGVQAGTVKETTMDNVTTWLATGKPMA